MEKQYLTAKLVGPVVQITVTAETLGEKEAKRFVAEACAVIEAMGRDVAQYDALICVSDPVAFGCLSAVQRMGLRVPDDLAITGFGHFEVAQVSNPRITTVNVHAAEIGRAVVGLLQRIFAGGVDVPVRVDVGSELVVGETS